MLVLAGPTAVGKTAVSVEVARRLNGEIISADSMQVYRGMNIGTAKITSEEMCGVPHHLIDIVDPGEAFSVAQYQTQARVKISEIAARGHLPMLVGGTNLYIKAVIDPYNFIEVDTDWELRDKLKRMAEETGTESLHKWLSEVDPQAAARIHENDLRRVVRALEVYQTTGRPLTEWEQSAPPAPQYELVYIALSRPREELYDRINARVDKQLAEGLIEEVQGLLGKGLAENFIAQQGLGYKEIIDFLSGRQTLVEASARLKQATRNYAKRQLTWLRADPRVKWIEIEPGESAEKTVNSVLALVAVDGKVFYNACKI